MTLSDFDDPVEMIPNTARALAGREVRPFFDEHAARAAQLAHDREFTYHCAARKDAGEAIIKDIPMARKFTAHACGGLSHGAEQILGGNRVIVNETVTKQMGR